MRISGYSMIKNKGVNNAALAKAASEEQHLRRIKSGKGTARDVLKEAGGITMLNMFDIRKISKQN
jgi:hypothetical protein